MCRTSTELLVVPDDTGSVRPPAAPTEPYESARVLTRPCVRTWESHRCKVLTSRYSELSTSLDNIISDANAQLTNLQNKLASKSRRHESRAAGITDIREAWRSTMTALTGRMRNWSRHTRRRTESCFRRKNYTISSNAGPCSAIYRTPRLTPWTQLSKVVPLTLPSRLPRQSVEPTNINLQHRFVQHSM